jgi:CBS domain-containing protein
VFLHRVREVSPGTPLGEAIALLRVAPHRIVPVTDGGRLVGMLTERCLTRALLAAKTDEARATLRGSAVSSLMEPGGPYASPEWSPEELLRACDDHSREVLPLVEGSGRFLGLIGRSDVIDELLAPSRLPPIGGMATPLGVYLTSGSAAAGAGGTALALTGMLTCLTQAGLYLALDALVATVVGRLPLLSIWWFALDPALRQTLGALGMGAAFGGSFLLLLRLSPLAGFHAAEHQVVHAIERGEPLLVECVRLMPREHPRCGTNYIAAIALLSAGAALVPLLGNGGYILGGLVALTLHRRFGGWLQRHLTTRRASPEQLRSGIQAAEALLLAHARQDGERQGLPWRIWRSGLVQILLGYILALGILATTFQLWPTLGTRLLALRAPLF